MVKAKAEGGPLNGHDPAAVETKARARGRNGDARVTQLTGQPDYRRIWQRTALRQAGIVVYLAGGTVLEMWLLAQAPNPQLTRISDLRPPALTFEQAAGIVVGLTALVFALSTALMAAPRVSEESTEYDRIALAAWGRGIVRAILLAAGVALGVALATIGAPPFDAQAILVAVALLATYIAALSGQRSHDQLHGGWLDRRVTDLRTARKELKKFVKQMGISPAQARSPAARWRARLQSLVPIFAGAGLLWVVAAAFTLARGGAVASGIGDAVEGLALALGLSAFFVAPVLLTTTDIIGRSTISRWSRFSNYLWQLVFPAFLTVVVPLSSGPESWEEVVAFLLVMWSLVGVGMAFQALALRGRGPWRWLALPALASLNSQVRIAKSRASELRLRATLT